VHGEAGRALSGVVLLGEGLLPGCVEQAFLEGELLLKGPAVVVVSYGYAHVFWVALR
jgi:hypothetical protein